MILVVDINAGGLPTWSGLIGFYFLVIIICLMSHLIILMVYHFVSLWLEHRNLSNTYVRMSTHLR